MTNERASIIQLGDDQLVAILHEPSGVLSQPSEQDGSRTSANESPSDASDVGILFVVGGPQYRIGSHRSHVHTARHLCAAGYPCMRFDYRGMGDSSGPFTEFEDAAADINAAIDHFFDVCDALTSVVVLGLCDAASAALMHTTDDPRLGGMILMNPWVRSTQTEARTMLKHYYLRRLVSKQFWQKLFSGKLNVFKAAGGLKEKVGQSRVQEKVAADFRLEMLRGAQRFSRPVQLIMSGLDYTAREFDDLVATSKDWQKATMSWSRVDLAEANHTVSRHQHKQELAQHCVSWLHQISRKAAQQ